METSNVPCLHDALRLHEEFDTRVHLAYDTVHNGSPKPVCPSGADWDAEAYTSDQALYVECLNCGDYWVASMDYRDLGPQSRPKLVVHWDQRCDEAGCPLEPRFSTRKIDFHAAVEILRDRDLQILTDREEPVAILLSTFDTDLLKDQW